MTFHSSFLVRCWLGRQSHDDRANIFQVEHVQTGAKYRASDISEVSKWMTDINSAYLTRLLVEPNAEQNQDEEDAQ